MKAKKIQIAIISILFLSLVLSVWFKGEDAFSKSERRTLKKFPELSLETVMNGKFMKEFEEYSLDQFPLRDTLRGIKAGWVFGIYQQMDNNKLYMADGHISKIEYPYNENSIDNAVKIIKGIYDRMLKDKNCNIYYAVIPDKNYFLADKNGYLSIDYDRLTKRYTEGLSDYTYIDIFDLLTIDDYYETDTHWKQECIVDVAEKLADSMGTKIDTEYTYNELEGRFDGVYQGQLSLGTSDDKIVYLTNDTINAFEVINMENNKPMGVYDMDKAAGDDRYETYLSGSLSLITIDNPNAKTDKELIIFRDSFGSSIAPILATGYKKVTIADIRYISSAVLSRFIDATDADVLFLYSTLVLNNSNTFKQ